MKSGTPDADTTSAVRSCRDQFPDAIASAELLFGFDGYIDRIREIVEGVNDDARETDRTVSSMGTEILEAGEMERSIIIEWDQTGTRTGGHACHLARGTGRLGYEPAMVGMFGEPPEDIFRRDVDPAELVSIGEPGVVDAIEFVDGKVFLVDSGSIGALDWHYLRERVDLDRLVDLADGRDLFGIGYWAEIGDFPSVLDGIRTDLLPSLSEPPSHLLVDPADIGDLDRDRFRRGVESIRALDGAVPVTVSANRSETTAIAELSGVAEPGRDLRETAERVREALGVSRFAAHSAEESVVVTAESTGRAQVPRTSDPELTTSAGDHFNVGLVLALLEGLDAEAAVVLGNAVAGHFVRTAEPPTHADLADFVDAYLERF
ncbi:hypothetical protein GJ633_01000 [Halorubrum sp. CBA1125]|uniref:PfkB family carbohydrate kinase n=1 Tax=Halorubrum sp. CBA1125 TaxID=2668072 RepID=UPI0012E93DE5|nr:PfkB family carbohydrate kinase [Halorubrum sp. CBA1125]MUW13388.1 hypothetical protein [Halorubrum sp. CBA1125]